MLKQFLKSKHLPWILGVAAVVVMLPALKTGLMTDDLIQRIPQLKPSQIPPALYQTGVVPDNTGKLSAVLFETFGFSRDREHWRAGRNYGVLPWWLPDETKCSLWRPFTALTHWLDYRLFPDSPVLMHAHNIAWFAAIVFLATVIYRKIIGPTWVAGLAALMFVLDSNTYFPVMFIANRGFIVALCLGLLCFYMHYKWRSTNSTFAAILSVILFSLSLLSNEAGVSTFAFILAYALVLDKVSWSKRFLSLLPAILVIIIWRIVYQSLGYGISGIGAAYLDPGCEPLKFLHYLPAYLAAIIAGQLSALPPDAMFGFKLQYLAIISIFYIGFTIIAIVFFLPIIRRDTIARFWFAAMIFAAIPVVAAPAGKNFGFVAVGAFGLIAVFADDLIKNQSWLPASRLYKYPAWVLCIIFLIAHIPLAAFSRYTIPKVAPALLGTLTNSAALDNISLSSDSHVVVVNAPCYLSVCAMPFNAAYYGRPIPESIRALAFAYTALEIERINEKSLVIRSKENNIFTSDQSSSLHFSHAFATADRLFYNSRIFEKNRRFVLKDLTIEILALDNSNLPKEIAFIFDVPLEYEKFRWLQFNWHTFSYEPFNLPKPGEIVTTQGPPIVRFRSAVRFLLRGR
jgi:hypothetical protein